MTRDDGTRAAYPRDAGRVGLATLAPPVRKMDTGRTCLDPRGPDMFEKFTDEARRVVVFAQEESGRLHHDYIGTEHLLLGLLRVEDGGAAAILADRRVDLAGARRRVEEIIGPGQAGDEADHIPFTPRAKKILEMALREAMELGQRHIGTEHLLLAMLREGGGVGARILQAYDVDLVSVRQRVAEGPGPAPQTPAGNPEAPAGPEPPVSSLLERLDRIEGLLAQMAARLAAIERRLD